MGVFEYYDPDTASIIYHVVPSLGSHNESSTIQSETESTTSGITIQSDEVPGYFVLHHGQPQFATDNVTRWIPPDNIRLHILRYLVCRWLLGGDYVGPVAEVLAPISGKTRRVLELGTRAGTWIQSMACTFPHVQFRTLDLAPVVAHVPRQNVVYEVYDYTEGLLMENDSQDIVFLNCLAPMVKDYRGLLREVHRVLRPGGLAHIINFSVNVWDSNNDTIVAKHTNPGVFYYLELLREQLTNGGTDPDICTILPKLLESKSDLWDHDSNKVIGFTQVHSAIKTFPFHPHIGFDCARQMDPMVAAYIAHFTTMSFRGTVGLIKDHRMTDEEAEKIIEDAIVELEQPNRCLLGKLYSVCAIKM